MWLEGSVGFLVDVGCISLAFQSGLSLRTFMAHAFCSVFLCHCCVSQLCLLCCREDILEAVERFKKAYGN